MTNLVIIGNGYVPEQKDLEGKNTTIVIASDEVVPASLLQYLVGNPIDIVYIDKYDPLDVAYVMGAYSVSGAIKVHAADEAISKLSDRFFARKLSSANPVGPDVIPTQPTEAPADQAPAAEPPRQEAKPSQKPHDDRRENNRNNRPPKEDRKPQDHRPVDEKPAKDNSPEDDSFVIEDIRPERGSSVDGPFANITEEDIQTKFSDAGISPQYAPYIKAAMDESKTRDTLPLNIHAQLTDISVSEQTIDKIVDFVKKKF